MKAIAQPSKAIYLAAIVMPLVGIFFVHKYYGAVAFSVALIVYALVFRPIVDGLRLMAIGKLKKNDFWKMFIPFYGATR